MRVGRGSVMVGAVAAESGDECGGIVTGAAVVRQLRQGRTHRACVAHGGEGQTPADRGGQPLELRRGDAAKHGGQHDRSRDQAHLALDVPFLRTSMDVEAAALSAEDSAIEHRPVSQPRATQDVRCLLRALTGSAYENNVAA